MRCTTGISASTAAADAIPDDAEAILARTTGSMAQALTAPASSFPPGGRPPMRRTETVDHGIVLVGELHLVLDDSETVMHPGDVVIQRGTDHAWENRSDQTASMVFILVHGEFDEELRASIQ